MNRRGMKGIKTELTDKGEIAAECKRAKELLDALAERLSAELTEASQHNADALKLAAVLMILDDER